MYFMFLPTMARMYHYYHSRENCICITDTHNYTEVTRGVSFSTWPLLPMTHEIHLPIVWC
jgi:hypothetical protein